jgi:hypothetical protein
VTVLAATLEGINETDFLSSEFVELPGGQKRTLLAEEDEE